MIESRDEYEKARLFLREWKAGVEEESQKLKQEGFTDEQLKRVEAPFRTFMVGLEEEIRVYEVVHSDEVPTKKS